MNELINRFNEVILKKDNNNIYYTACKICRAYFYKYKKEYGFNNIDIDEVISDVTVELFEVIRKRPDKESRYYFGVIKQATKWVILKRFKHHSNELFLSDLLDTDRRYPESMMKSVSDLANSSSVYLGTRKICSILIERADQFLTINETAKCLGMKSGFIYNLAKKYNINFINGILKQKKKLFEIREKDYNSYIEGETDIKEIAEKWNVGLVGAKRWITSTKKEQDYIKNLKCWHYIYNNFPVPSFQELSLISSYNFVYIPKESYSKDKKEVEIARMKIKIKENGSRYEKDILFMKEKYLKALEDYNSLREMAGYDIINI